MTGIEGEQSVGSNPKEFSPKEAVLRHRSEQTMEEKQTLERHAPAARLPKAAGKAVEKGLEGSDGRNGEDFQKLMNVSLRQWQVVGRRGLHDQKVKVTEAPHGSDLSVTRAALLSQSIQNLPNSSLHIFETNLATGSWDSQ